jgi:hypothetical protein
MFAKRIDQEMVMLSKEVVQSFALSAKPEKTAKGVSEKKGNEARGLCWTNMLSGRGRVEELGEQVV